MPTVEGLSERLRRGLHHLGLTPPPEDHIPMWEPRFASPRDRRPTFPGLISQACTADQVRSPRYAELCAAVDQPHLMHRKQWEWMYILQALHETDMVRPGVRALGFGVGTEPITPYLARHGVHVTATDLPAQDPSAEHWRFGEQHTTTVEAMNADGLCDPALFRQQVEFRPVDMRHVPDDLTGFDATWSSCAFEHLGDVAAGLDFVERSLECLRPGGVAVHTTEFNVSSNRFTVESGPNVAYRRRDLRQLAARLRRRGHQIELSGFSGDSSEDGHVDLPPYSNTHLKTTIGPYIVTSVGLIIRRA